jgi:8-oxo-dGTP pyrophosphatase MutT (NUDIX family)
LSRWRRIVELASVDERDTREAVVVVMRRHDQVLVIKRAPSVIFPGYWTPLSGRVRTGETQEEAVAREALEEVGLAADPVSMIWECDTEDGQFHLYWWLADAGPGASTLQPDEVSEAKWIAPSEFGDLAPTFADDRRFFTEVLPLFSRRRAT